MIYSKIIGTGSYLPPKILTNADLTKMVDTTEEWIFSRTGIHERHIVTDECSSDLALQATLNAIESAGIDARQIDLIIVATTTPDKIFPSVAAILQRKLGIAGCPAFDIQAVCSGFIYALTTANQFIKSGAAKCVLVVGAETISKITNYKDRSNCILWGDGAGAVILKASDEAGIMTTHIHADGNYEQMLHVPRQATSKDSILMEGNAVFKMAVNTLDQIVDETLMANNLQKSDIDWLVPHQANIRILQATAKKLDLPMERVIVTVDKHGNTSAASIPLALDTAVRDGRIKRGELILMEAFGGGFTWGSVLLRY